MVQPTRAFSSFFYSSSEEEEGDKDSWDGKNSSSTPSYGEEFRIQKASNGRAVYQPEYASYYIPLMKKAISEVLAKVPFRERTEFLPDVKNLQAMTHQNLDSIKVECPQFITTLYEFLAYTQYSHPNYMRTLEQCIVETNIVNMPPAGIKNFLRAMVRFGSGEAETIQPVVDLLAETTAYNDIKVNIQTIRSLVDTQHRCDDYICKSLEAYKNEYDTQKEKGTLAIETEKTIDRSQNFFMISHYTVGNIFKLVVDYAFVHDIEFTEEMIADFSEKMPIVEEEGKRTITGNPTTIEEHIYFQTVQNGLILGREQGRANGVLLQAFVTLETKIPNLFNSIPEIKTARDVIMRNFTDKVSFKQRTPGFIAGKIQDSFTKAGVNTEFGTQFTPFGALYLFDEENKMSYDYYLPSSFIKTSTDKKLRLYQLQRINYLKSQGIETKALTVRHFKVNEKNEKRFDQMIVDFSEGKNLDEYLTSPEREQHFQKKAEETPAPATEE